jgi:hypothetical protein
MHFNKIKITYHQTILFEWYHMRYGLVKSSHFFIYRLATLIEDWRYYSGLGWVVVRSADEATQGCRDDDMMRLEG